MAANTLSATVGNAASREFLRYVNETGSPYHSVAAVKRILLKYNFQQLREQERWNLSCGGRYFVVRNHSAIMAFVIGEKFKNRKGGYTVIAAHTDSPCLRLRPNNSITSNGFMQLGVECYGGGLWHTWLDRGLGLAGKVVLSQTRPATAAVSEGCLTVNEGYPKLREVLVRLDHPVAVLPSLAIHLQTTEERTALKLHKENNLQPVICSVLKRQLLVPEETAGKRSPPLLDVLSKECNCNPDDIVDADICLMDATPSRHCGVYSEFVESPRLDNLVSTWAAFQALVDVVGGPEDATACAQGKVDDVCVAVSFDGEEIGSQTWTGANSSALEGWLNRIEVAMEGSDVGFRESLSRSFIISADMAHGLHPNYVDKHQKEHQPIIHKGIVLKENANQRYASECTSMAITRQIARIADVPVQEFVVRNDSPCGSTVGPMLASILGVRTVDIGVCQWAMHSCRETCGTDDIAHLHNFFKAFFSSFRQIECDEL
eukprot:GHVS01058499.1.p1 GENE.GHVS01058499.1~~GHVS01058499.1.p1  ORF type:complete len:488 (-),score=57.87 GHVS01058499.1:270-1733(-)